MKPFDIALLTYEKQRGLEVVARLQALVVYLETQTQGRKIS